MSQIYCYGADPFQDSPSSKTLLKALLGAGFKKGEIKYVDSPDSISSDSYCLCFGAIPFKVLTGCDEPLSKYHGMLFDKHDDPSVFVLPTYSPGYLFYNERERSTFEAELELFLTIIRIDQGLGATL